MAYSSGTRVLKFPCCSTIPVFAIMVIWNILLYYENYKSEKHIDLRDNIHFLIGNVNAFQGPAASAGARIRSGCFLSYYNGGRGTVVLLAEAIPSYGKINLGD